MEINPTLSRDMAVDVQFAALEFEPVDPQNQHPEEKLAARQHSTARCNFFLCIVALPS